MRPLVRHWLPRFAGGLTLLLLPFAEARSCPWLRDACVRQAARADEAGATGGAPADRTPSGKRKPAPLTLASVLPEAAPPRWPTPAPGSAAWRGDADGASPVVPFVPLLAAIDTWRGALAAGFARRSAPLCPGECIWQQRDVLLTALIPTGPPAF